MNEKITCTKTSNLTVPLKSALKCCKQYEQNRKSYLTSTLIKTVINKINNKMTQSKHTAKGNKKHGRKNSGKE